MDCFSNISYPTIQTITQHFLTPQYLKNGTETQRKVWAAWETLKITEHLHAYAPTLAGTYPLGIEISGSDLDILCEVYDVEKFELLIQSVFGEYFGFCLRRVVKQELESIVCSFYAEGFEWELFGQSRPVVEQQAFRHLVVEELLLELCDNKVREEIRLFKLSGLKTEPAFARYFSLNGDPYQRLLELYNEPIEEFLQVIGASHS